MADLGATVAEIKPTGANGVYESHIAGVTVTAGQWVYIDPADNKAKLAVATSLATARVRGMAMHAALADQEVQIQTDGDITYGTTTGPTLGLLYILSGTAGAISPHTDATTPASGEYMTSCAVAASASTLRICICASDQALA